MLYSIKNRDGLEKLNKLVCLQNHLKTLTLQVKLRKQNIHGDIKKVLEHVTKTIKDASEDVTKTMMVTSKENDEANVGKNNKFLEMLIERVYNHFICYLLYLKSPAPNILAILS